MAIVTKIRAGVLIACASAAWGCGIPGPTWAGPARGVRVGTVYIPSPAIARELRPVVVDDYDRGFGLGVAAAMTEIVEQARAQGGNYIFVDDVHTNFKVIQSTHVDSRGGTHTGSQEVASTYVHARIFFVFGDKQQ